MTHSTLPESAYYSTAEAAAYLGFPESTLRYWRAAGAGPPSARLGRRVVYPKDRLREWVESRLTEAS